MLRATPVTSGFVGLCVLIYAITAYQARSLMQPLGGSAVFRANGVEWWQDLSWSFIFDAGRISAYDEWWRLLTPALLHVDPGHLLFNGFLIFMIGREIEKFYGSRAAALISVAGALGGGLACLFFAPQVQMAGASTVAYGYLALLLVMAYQRKSDFRGPLTLVIVNFGYTFMTANVSIWGHIGGFAGGIIAAAVILGFRGLRKTGNSRTAPSAR